MSEVMTVHQVLEIIGTTEDFLRVLEQEAIVQRQGQYFTVHQVERIRVCWNLHAELGVNIAGIEVALHLLDRLDRERQQHLALLREIASRSRRGR